MVWTKKNKKNKNYKTFFFCVAQKKKVTHTLKNKDCLLEQLHEETLTAMELFIFILIYFHFFYYEKGSLNY